MAAYGMFPVGEIERRRSVAAFAPDPFPAAPRSRSEMVKRPSLQTDLPVVLSPDALDATVSPARGKEMRANLLQKLRPPPLVHVWDFWHDRQDRQASMGGGGSSIGGSISGSVGGVAVGGVGGVAAGGIAGGVAADVVAPAEAMAEYEGRLIRLCTVTDVRDFWGLFNNFDVAKLQLRDTVHLFHKGVKPLWEDARNMRGGGWTFRVSMDRAKDFWKEVCMMAIGEQLQAAVASSRTAFLDDICGISFSVRFTSVLVTVWNRDADHAAGIANILAVVLQHLPPDLLPRDGSYYYKRHSEHAGFGAHAGVPAAAASAAAAASKPLSPAAQPFTMRPFQSFQAVQPLHHFRPPVPMSQIYVNSGRKQSSPAAAAAAIPHPGPVPQVYVNNVRKPSSTAAAAAIPEDAREDVEAGAVKRPPPPPPSYHRPPVHPPASLDRDLANKLQSFSFAASSPKQGQQAKV